MLSAPQTLTAAFPQVKKAERREAIVKDLHGATVDVQPIGSGVVFSDVVWSGITGPVIEGRCTIEKVRNRYVAYNSNGSPVEGAVSLGSIGIFSTTTIGVGGGGGGLVAHALNGAYHTGTLDDVQAPQFYKLDGSRALTSALNFGSAGNLNKTGSGLLQLASAGSYTITFSTTGMAALGAGTLSFASVADATIAAHTHPITGTIVGAPSTFVATTPAGAIVASDQLKSLESGVWSRGTAAKLKFDSTATSTNYWQWSGDNSTAILLASVSGVVTLQISNAGALTAASSVSANNGPVSSFGSGSGLFFADQITGTTPGWTIKAFNGVFSLGNSTTAAVIAATTAGAVTIAGTLDVTGGKIYGHGSAAELTIDDASNGATKRWRLLANGNNSTWGRADIGQQFTWTAGSGILNTFYTDADGRIGAGVIPTASFHARSTTGPQLKVEYTGSFGMSLQVSNAGDVTWTQTGPRLMFASGPRLQSDNYSSQTTGWGLTYPGALDVRYIYTDEMHARKFVADTEFAFAGLQIVAKSWGILSLPFTAPAAGATTTAWFWDMKGSVDTAVFENGDFINVRQWDRTGGGLAITNCWGVVTAYADGSGATAGMQSYTFTRTAGTIGGASNTGAMASGTVIPIDTTCVDYGSSAGSPATGGYYEVNAIDGLYGVNSPYAQTVKWTTHPAGFSPATKVVTSRYGNLYGIFAQANEYGIYAGNGFGTADKWIRASSYAAELHNMPLNIYDGANLAMTMEPSTPYFSLGSVAPTGYLVGNGIWMGKDTGAYKFRIGTIAAGAVNAGMTWDGTSLKITGSAYIGNGTAFQHNPLLYLPFDAAPNGVGIGLSGHKGQIPAKAGGLMGISRGRYGGALAVGETSTNLLGNPRFANASYFAGFNLGPNLSSAATTDAFFGSEAVLCTTASATGNRYFYSTMTRTNSANPMSVSAWVKAVTGTVSLQIGVWANGLAAASATVYSVGTDWVYITKSVPAATMNAWATPLTVNWLINETTGTVGVKNFIVGFAQAEEKAYSTPPICGDFSPQGTSEFQWAGTAHQSFSTRTHSNLSYPPTFVGPVGTVSAWVWPGTGSGGTNTDYRVVVHSASANYLVLRLNNSGYLEGYWGSSAITSSTVVPAGQWSMVSVTSDGGFVTLYLNGAQVYQGTGANNISATNLYVGQINGNDQCMNGYIDDLFVTNKCFSADEVAQLYASNAPLGVTRSNFDLVLTEFGKGKVILNSGGIFATSLSGKPNFHLLNYDATVNSESLLEGDVLLGDNSASVTNLLFKKSDGTFRVRVGTTDNISMNATNIWVGTVANSRSYMNLTSSGLSLKYRNGSGVDEPRIEVLSGGINIGNYGTNGNAWMQISPTNILLNYHAAGVDTTYLNISSGGMSVGNSNSTFTGDGNALLNLNGGSLVAGSVTAEKLKIGTFGDNLLFNPGFENADTSGWTVLEQVGGAFSATTAASYEGSYSGLFSGSYGAITSKAVPVTAGQTYAFRIMALCNLATPAGFYVRLYFRTSYPASGYVTGVAGTSQYTTLYDFVSGANFPTVWTSYEFTRLIPGTAGTDKMWVSWAIYNASSGTKNLYIDDATIRRQFNAVTIQDGTITAAKLEAEMIMTSRLYGADIRVGNITSDSGWGAGVPGNGFSGLRMYKPTGTTATLVGYSGGVAQAYFDSDGQIKSGAGATVMGANGLQMEYNSTGSYDQTRAVRFYNTSGARNLGVLYQAVISSSSALRLDSYANGATSSNHANVALVAVRGDSSVRGVLDLRTDAAGSYIMCSDGIHIGTSQTSTSNESAIFGSNAIKLYTQSAKRVEISNAAIHLWPAGVASGPGMGMASVGSGAADTTGTIAGAVNPMSGACCAYHIVMRRSDTGAVSVVSGSLATNTTSGTDVAQNVTVNCSSGGVVTWTRAGGTQTYRWSGWAIWA